MSLTLTNLFTVCCGIVMTWASWQIYTYFRAPGMLWLVAAFTYITVFKTIVTIHTLKGGGWVTDHQLYLITPFWLLSAIAMVTLARSLTGQFNYHDIKEFTGTDRRRKR